MARPHPADAHAFCADLPQDGESSSDVGDARALDLFLAEPVRCHEGQQQTFVSHQHVVQLADELLCKFLLVGLLGNDGLPRLAETIYEVRERQYEGFTEEAGLGAEMAEE